MAAIGLRHEKKRRLDLSMAEPDDSNSILNSFHKSHELVQRLKQLSCELSKMSSALCMVKIVECSGHSADSFANIYCKTERNIERYDTPVKQFFSFRSIFQKAWKLLNAYADNESYAPSNPEMRRALVLLLSFITDYKDSEKCLADASRKDVSEADWCKMLAHHYFSKLAVNSHYVINNRCHATTSLCPCDCHQSIEGVYGNTSIGHQETWHGCVDVMMGSIVPVVTSVESVSSSGKNGTAHDYDPLIRGRRQMIGQTIVFSFLQKQRHPEYNNFLIPTICLSKNDILYLFYDAKHDILLESPPQRLLEGRKHLNIFTALVTWLVLNYNLFGTGVTTEMMKMDYKADFPTYAGEKLEIYRNKLHYCCVTKCIETFVEPWSLSGVQVNEGRPVDNGDTDDEV